MRVSQQPACVLHHYSYRETSVLLELFTRNHGRLGVLAKGARRSGRRQRAPIEPFQPLLVDWSGRGELPVLAAVELDGDPVFLNGVRLYCGFYMNELLLRLLHRHDPHESLFMAYRASLAVLTADGPVESTLRVFEKRLLQEVGYGLVLDQEITDNRPIDPEGVYEYVVDRGPVQVTDSAIGRPGRGIRVSGSSLLALAHETLVDPQALRETKALMRGALARHLGGKPLNSRKLFRNVKQPPVDENQETGGDEARR